MLYHLHIALFIYICQKNSAMDQIMIPQTMDEIMLIQPNNVTFGQYSLTPVQENVLTLIIDAIQKHMTKQQELPRDLFNQPYVEIECDEARGENNKANVKRAIRDMYKKEFRFRWLHPQIHKTIESEGTIISTMHDVKGTNRVVLNFNVWAIPFLVYYGVGVGGTRFNKAIALNIRGEYPKRIYKIICRWKDKSTFTYSIEQLRKDLNLPDSYNNTQLERAVLKPAVVKIKESGSDVWFEYELTCERPVKGQKPKADTILFKIINRKPIETKGESYNQYVFVHRWLSDCWDTMKSSKAREIADKLNEMGELEKVYKRCCYWDDLITSGKRDKAGQAMTTAKALNSLKKMLREDFKLS
jgi:plasmid replication initiation protein